ncbi:MAG: hypothetical protein H6727_00300 [Myxococcales bacterium]|nr:hypothetical protein [Myxococcales bacterium]
MYRIFFSFLSLALFSQIACSGKGGPCQEDKDCPPRTYCNVLQKVCLDGCRYHIDCDNGQVCVGNQCATVQDDKDQDGFPPPIDCNDNDPLIKPGNDEYCGNNIDDNCNGQIDEVGCIQVECTPGETRDCYDGLEKTLTFPGTQCKKGKQTCNSTGIWGICQGQVLPAAEICDGLDNDCDGQIDNDADGNALSRSCYSGPKEAAGIGACKEGRERCNNKTWSACEGEILPATETCDGIDNDCDGQVDNVEGTGAACDTQQPGVCKTGTMVCDTQTGKLACLPDTKASNELCGDNLDNDCDGQIDNGCVYQPFQITIPPSYPHHVALSDAWGAVSLRDTKKLLLFDRSANPPMLKYTIDLAEEPSGIALDTSYAYLQLPQAIERIDLSDGKQTTWVTLPKRDHSGSLLLLQNRLYGRFRGQDSQGQPEGGLCRIDIASQQILCNGMPSASTSIGQDTAPFGIYVLAAGVDALLWIDILQMQETSSKNLTLPAGIDQVAVDTSLARAVVTNPTKREIYLVDLNQRQLLNTLTLSDQQGGNGSPGPVVTFDGTAIVGHRDGGLLSFIDLNTRQVTRQVKVGLGILGLAVSPPNAQKERTLWVASAGDNTLWRVLLPAPTTQP